jgi:hypothetical protein
MSSNNELKEAIQRLAGTFLKDNVHSFDAAVIAVNEDEFTCDVKSIGSNSEVEIPNVRLSSESNDGFTLIPSIDSTVTIIMTDKGIPYVAMYSDIDKAIVIIEGSKLIIEKNKITFNDGLNGGIIKIQDLTTSINNRFSLIKTALVAAFTAQASIDGSVGLNAFNSAIASDQPLNKDTYENTKIKH